jgi:di/tripeptidase
MARCQISCKVPETYDWTRFGLAGAIVTINEVINRILEIPLPSRPKTSIVLGTIEGGTHYNTIATEANLRFEIRSESGDMVYQLSKKIADITSEIASHTGSELEYRLLAKRQPGGIHFSHPLSDIARKILKKLNVKSRISPSTSELSAFIAKDIPALTIGLTNGENMSKKDETIELEPVFTGLAQLIGLILAIDRGSCNESK